MSVMPYVFPAAAALEKRDVEQPDLVLTVAALVTPWGCYSHMKDSHSAVPQNRQIKYTSVTRPGAKGVQFCT